MKVSTKFVFDPAHWRGCAEHMRQLATEMQDGVLNRATLRVAEEYEQLARRVQERCGASKTR
jgi:hypothetical protein